MCLLHQTKGTHSIPPQISGVTVVQNYLLYSLWKTRKGVQRCQTRSIDKGMEMLVTGT